MPEVKRVPIVVSEHTIAMLTLFNKRSIVLMIYGRTNGLPREAHQHHKRSAAALRGLLRGQMVASFLHGAASRNR